MNKELEALEKLANNALTDEERKLYKDIIEVNLEMYEELKTKAMQTELELGEKETILNILVKKEVNIQELFDLIKKYGKHNGLYMYNRHRPYEKRINEEQLDLLKEVSKYGKL